MQTMKKFYKHLYGQEFQQRTDHSALIWIMSFKNIEEQTARWIRRLLEYTFYFPAPPRPETQQCRCPFATTMPRGVYLLPQNRGAQT
jgi:hypothetical protein